MLQLLTKRLASLPLSRRARPLTALAALGAWVCLLAPAATSAHGGIRLRASATGAGLEQEATTPGQQQETSTSADEPSPETSGGENGEKQDKHSRRRGAAADAAGCSVTLQQPSSAIAPDSPFTLTGTLNCPEGVAVEGQTVTLYERAAHTAGFDVSASAAVETGGGFQFALSGVEGDTVFYVRCDGAKSARIRIRVALQVSIEAPATGAQLFTGAGHAASDGESASSNTVTITGTVSPGEAGATVALQRETRGGAWYHIGRGQVDDEGKFSIVHTFLQRGEAHVRVVVRTHGLYAATPSAPVTYLISGRHEKDSGANTPSDG